MRIRRSIVGEVDATGEDTVLRIHGLKELGSSLWAEASKVSDRAKADVTARVKAEYGVRSPRNGLIPTLVLILAFAGAIPIGFLNAIRLGSTGGEITAAVLTAGRIPTLRLSPASTSSATTRIGGCR